MKEWWIGNCIDVYDHRSNHAILSLEPSPSHKNVEPNISAFRIGRREGKHTHVDTETDDKESYQQVKRADFDLPVKAQRTATFFLPLFLKIQNSVGMKVRMVTTMPEMAPLRM